MSDNVPLYELVPDLYYQESDKAAVCAWLLRQNINPLKKKLILISWCKYRIIWYDGNDVAKATGYPPGTL